MEKKEFHIYAQWDGKDDDDINSPVVPAIKK